MLCAGIFHKKVFIVSRSKRPCLIFIYFTFHVSWTAFGGLWKPYRAMRKNSTYFPACVSIWIPVIALTIVRFLKLLYLHGRKTFAHLPTTFHSSDTKTGQVVAFY